MNVLVIAAHPDDENTALLAYLARGRRVRMRRQGLTHAIAAPPRLSFEDFFEQLACQVFALKQNAHVRFVERRVFDQ